MPLPVYQCNKESIAQALNSPMPFNDKLDGLLIYHRKVRRILFGFAVLSAKLGDGRSLSFLAF